MNDYKLIYFDKSAGMTEPEETLCEDIEDVLRFIETQMGNYQREINESVGFQIICLNRMGFKI